RRDHAQSRASRRPRARPDLQGSAHVAHARAPADARPIALYPVRLAHRLAATDGNGLARVAPHLALTRRADAVELVLVRAEIEPVLPRHLVLQALDAGLLELGDAVALDADQVVVVTVTVSELVARDAVAEMALVGDAALGEQFERAIHGGVTDLGIG